MKILEPAFLIVLISLAASCKTGEVSGDASGIKADTDTAGLSNNQLAEMNVSQFSPKSIAGHILACSVDGSDFVNPIVIKRQSAAFTSRSSKHTKPSGIIRMVNSFCGHGSTAAWAESL